MGRARRRERQQWKRKHRHRTPWWWPLVPTLRFPWTPSAYTALGPKTYRPVAGQGEQGEREPWQ